MRAGFSVRRLQVLHRTRCCAGCFAEQSHLRVIHTRDLNITLHTWKGAKVPCNPCASHAVTKLG